MGIKAEFADQFEKENPEPASKEKSNGQKSKQKTRQKRWDMEGFLQEHKWAYLPGEKEENGSIKYTLHKCPLCNSEGDRKTAVFVDAEGKPGFHCFHGVCSGKTWNDFYRHFVPEITPYERTKNCMVWNNWRGDSTDLCNFTAEITADVTIDDGAETTRAYELSAELMGRKLTFDVPANAFAAGGWVDQHLGARAWIAVGQSMRSHLINAIKSCSEDLKEQTYYAHTGWRNIGGTMTYLHADGGLSQVSQVGGGQKHSLDSPSTPLVEPDQRDVSQVSQVSQVNKYIGVKLGSNLMNYRLPAEIPDLKLAIRASLGFLDLVSDPITVPLYCSCWRAPIGNINYGVHVAGQTGLGKTELVALIQQHYGQAMTTDKLPGSWESTDNSLEMLLFQAKDVVLTVDDFKPKGSKNNQDRLHSKADRVFRQIGNGSARGRLTATLEQRPERRPRCLLISTGEDVPRGQSLKARGVVIVMDQQITCGEASKRLSQAQKHAASGLYAQAMAGYIAWLAPQIQDIQAHLQDKQGFSHFKRRRTKSESVYPRQVSLKRRLLFFMRPCLKWLKP